MSRREVVMIYSEIYWTSLGIIYIEAYMGWLYHDIHLHYWMAWKQAHVFSPSLGPWVTKGQSKAPQKFHGHPVSWNQLMPLTNHKLRLEQIWRKYEENPHKVKPILAPHFSHIFFSQWSIPSIPSIPTIPSIHSPLSSLHLWIRFCLVIGHQDHVLALPQDLLDALHIFQALAVVEPMEGVGPMAWWLRGGKRMEEAKWL